MRLSQRLTRRKEFSEPPFWSLDRYALLPSLGTGERERIGNDFEGYVQGAYKASGVVFATAMSRQFLFAQARMQWVEYRKGRPGPLFGNPALSILEQPWVNGTTADLLARMDQDVSVAGNSFWTSVDDDGRMGRAAVGGRGWRLTRMRPDWVKIVKGSKSGHPNALDAKLVAFEYAPPPVSGRSIEPVLLLPSEVCHYAPQPDPEASYRGMSWMTPILREIQADRAATKHKLKFFENGATLQHIVRMDKDTTPDDFDAFVARFKAQHEGVDTAYKTLFLGGGADLTPVGTNMLQIDFKQLQGGGETRIAAAAGMHPVIVGLSEGLQGSSLNAGNFDAAIRLTADKTLRFLWGNVAGSLERLVTAPRDGVRLTYDDRDIAFLRDDSTDVAEIQSKQATTARQLTDAGYTPESVIDFLETGDLQRLRHSGLFSVQLQKPGGGPDAPDGPTSEQGASEGSAASAPRAAAAKQRDVAETLQKVYLAVDKVITSDEARVIANKAGAELQVPGPRFVPPKPANPPEGV